MVHRAGAHPPAGRGAPPGCGLRLRPGLPDQSPWWESDLALAADVVFAASQGLIDHLSPCNDNIALLPNGVNHPMFTRPPAELPPELRGLSSPILGYTGTLWRDLDLAPVLYAAQAMPACTSGRPRRVRRLRNS